MQLHQQQSLINYAQQHHLQGLSTPSLTALAEQQQGYSVDKAQQFLAFQHRINTQMLNHPVIGCNRYTAWFAEGCQNLAQIKAFIIQFSVFSNQFLIAQLHKMIHADTLESMRASKQILANEIGVSFQTSQSQDSPNNLEIGEGSIEGSRFSFGAAHFEWLYNIAQKLGLSFADIGQPKHGSRTTLFFCNELLRLYGGNNYQVSQAASYAVENWAAAGFWGQLITGLKKFNEHSNLNLPLGFFIWHDKLEVLHATHTQEELEALYFSQNLDEDAFIHAGNEMLDGVAAFWQGLDEQRTELTVTH